MAWRRDTSTTKIGGSSLYAYTEVDWHVGATQCTYTHIGGCTSPYGGWSTNPTATLWWGEWNGSDYTWHEYASGSAHYTGSGDLELVRKNDYFTRTSSDRYIRLDCDVYASTSTGSGTGSAWLDYTVPALPPSATTLTATRDSDSKVSLSWTDGGGVKQSVRIERSVDGAAYGEIAVLGGTTTSWADTTTSAGHSYSYRFRYYNESAYGAYSNVQTVTMTPSAPTGITTAAIAGSTNVTVTLDNADPVATGIKWQYSTDKSMWLPETPNEESGSPVTSFTAAIAGSVYIRVANTNSVGDSAWLETTEKVTTICPPAAPTLLSPTGVLNMSEGSVTFSWQHNAIDGSAQTAVLIRYSTDGGSTWTSTMLNPKSGNTYTITPIPWAAGTTVTWQAKTKGADESYGEWASPKQFTVYQVPTLSFVADNPPTTVSTLPIPIEVTYTDPQGMACAAAYYQLYEGSRLVASEDMEINGGTLTQSITANEFLPVNGQTYTLTVTARSGSSLSASVSVSFDVDYVPPKQADLDITNDPDTGYASLLVKGMEDTTVEGESPLDLPTQEGDYIHSVAFEGDAERIVAPTDSYSGSTNTQYESEPNVIRSLNVVGQSAKWNQTLPSQNVNYAHSGGDYTITRTGTGPFTVTVTAVTTFAEPNVFWLGGTYMPSGHKMALLADSDIFRAGIKSYAGSASDSIISANGSGGNFTFFATNVPVGTYTVNVALIDLTAIFGAGNEPTTVDAFKATKEYKAAERMGVLYTYDAGSIVSIGSVGVVGRNLVDPDQLQNGYLQNNTTTLGGMNATRKERTSAYIPVTAGENLEIRYMVTPLSGETGWLSWQFYDAAHNLIGSRPTRSPSDANVNYTIGITAPTGANLIRVSCRFFDDGKLQLERGSTAHDYEPYMGGTITTPVRGLPQGKGDELVMAKTSWYKIERTYYDIISAVGTVNTSGSTWYAALTTTNQATLRRNWTSADDFNADRGTTGTEFAYCTKTTKISATGKGIFIARTWNALYAYCTAADASAQGITQSDFDALVGAEIIARNKTQPSAQTAITPIELGTAFTIGTELDSTFAMTADDGTDPYVLTTTGVGTVSGGSITHQALNLTTHSETYADILDGEWLAGIGDVHDEYADGVITRRIGCVDLGSLTYSYDSTNSIFYVSLSGKANGMTNLLTALYPLDTASLANMADKTIKGNATAAYVYIKNTAYTTAAAFKSAMSGVLLYYELATPVEVSVSEIAFQELEVPDTVSLNAYLPTELTVGYGQGLTEYDSISIYRVTDHRQLLAEDVSDGFSVVDKYAPLNTDYTYEVITYASSGAFAVHEVTNRIDSTKWFVYSGDEVFEADYTSGGTTHSFNKPNRKRINYAGRKDPVSYDDGTVNFSAGTTFFTIVKEQADAFERLMETTANGVVKTRDGLVFHADIDLSTSNTLERNYSGKVVFKAYRVSGDKL